MLEVKRPLFRHHPALLLKLCFIELWERFGFYATTGILVLFLTDEAPAGLGWTNKEALLLLATFGGLLYVSPLIGGQIADRFLGASRSVRLGGTMMMLGYLGLGGLPLLLMGEAGRELSNSGLPLGLLDAPPLAGMQADVASLYLGHAILFHVSMLLIILGAGLFKPCISTLVGGLYECNDPRRDGGFTLFWTCINLGVLLANIFAGGVGERAGWHFGFLMASAGMAWGLIAFRRIIPLLPGKETTTAGVTDVPRRAEPDTRIRLIIIATIILFATTFNAVFYQIYGLLTLFVSDDTDRMVGGFEIPTLWILALNPVVILLCAPFASTQWDRLSAQGRNPGALTKFLIALLLLGIASLMFVYAANQASPGAPGGLAIVVIAIGILSLGEIFVQPIGLSIISSLAPARFANLLMGAWFLNYAVGSWVAHSLGAMASDLGTATIFAMNAGLCFGGALVLLVIRRTIERKIVSVSSNEQLA